MTCTVITRPPQQQALPYLYSGPSGHDVRLHDALSFNHLPPGRGEETNGMRGCNHVRELTYME